MLQLLPKYQYQQLEAVGYFLYYLILRIFINEHFSAFIIFGIWNMFSIRLEHHVLYSLLIAIYKYIYYIPATCMHIIQLNEIINFVCFKRTTTTTDISILRNTDGFTEIFQRQIHKVHIHK